MFAWWNPWFYLNECLPTWDSLVSQSVHILSYAFLFLYSYHLARRKKLLLVSVFNFKHIDNGVYRNKGRGHISSLRCRQFNYFHYFRLITTNGNSYKNERLPVNKCINSYYLTEGASNSLAYTKCHISGAWMSPCLQLNQKMVRNLSSCLFYKTILKTWWNKRLQ